MYPQFILKAELFSQKAFKRVPGVYSGANQKFYNLIFV